MFLWEILRFLECHSDAHNVMSFLHELSSLRSFLKVATHFSILPSDWS